MRAAEKERPEVARTTPGQPKTVEANGSSSFAHTSEACKQGCVAFRSRAGKLWRYSGKRGRVLEMLATTPGGVTQWDTLPWHTRLGGTIHALRRDGLAIDTQREGEFRHARYRLATPGSLLIQRENSEAAA